MRIKDVMTKNIITVDGKETAAKAAKQMKDANVGMVMIVENGEIKGLITDRAIVTKVVAEGKDPSKVSIREFMSKDIITCKEDSDVMDVIKTLGESRIRRVPVINESNKVVGVLSIADVAQEMKGCMDSLFDELSKAAR
ncbi:CBS domain-containing protein [Methanocella sp. CWC-04]|uniref:CBS domain-containing protein n=1 Tax=Methanooceanicella nereidis TaxID=2052831 RepID=A0AAP2RF91_9EURY|nr:CBS domain-containing protein [Methanocella sp. CWC-04]MCD1296304.1 CBS domain-containing protein [Methanocella sp. CWC-04]